MVERGQRYKFCIYGAQLVQIEYNYLVKFSILNESWEADMFSPPKLGVPITGQERRYKFLICWVQLIQIGYNYLVKFSTSNESRGAEHIPKHGLTIAAQEKRYKF